MSKKTVNVKVAFLGDPKIGKSEFIKNYAGEKSITKEKKEKGKRSTKRMKQNLLIII